MDDGLAMMTAMLMTTTTTLLLLLLLSLPPGAEAETLCDQPTDDRGTLAKREAQLEAKRKLVEKAGIELPGSAIARPLLTLAPQPHMQATSSNIKTRCCKPAG